MNTRNAICLLLVCLPMAAHAQAYKCKQANGTASFQDSPCASDAPGSAITLKAPAPSGDAVAAPSPANKATTRKPPSSRDPAQSTERDYLSRRADEELRAYNQGVKTHNQQIECNNARQQLGVAKAQRPIYRTDASGGRQYVSDDNRQSEIAAAERRVAQACQ